MAEYLGFKLPPAAWQDDNGVWRNHNGWPFILKPDGSGIEPYRRASSYANPLEDLNNIMGWKQRLTALGLAQKKHLLDAITLIADPESREGKTLLNGIVNEAFLAAGGEKKADIGTYIHSLTEIIDTIGPDEIYASHNEWTADLQAYDSATAGMKHDMVEQFVVCDEKKAAGTPDRITELLAPLMFTNGVTLPAGWRGITDLKTGSVNYPHGFAVQLGIYSRSQGYDPTTGTRFDLGVIDQDWALLIHLPAGEAKCEIHLLDIKMGWAAVSLAQEVSAWRGYKNLTFPVSRVPVFSGANVTVSQDTTDVLEKS